MKRYEDIPYLTEQIIPYIGNKRRLLPLIESAFRYVLGDESDEFEGNKLDEALAELKAKGRQTIDERPRELMGNRYAFIHHPKELCGVLTEVVDGEFNLPGSD